jgi:hypothetical protein
MANLEESTNRDARLPDLLEQVRERAPVYFPGVGAGAQVRILARRSRAYSDVYRLAIVEDRRPAREVILKVFTDAEIQYRAMVTAWPEFAQHETLKIPRPLDYLAGGPAIVMEAVHGRSLQARLPRINWLGRWTRTAERDCHRAGEWLRLYHGRAPLANGRLDVDAKCEDFRLAAKSLADTGIAPEHSANWVSELRTDADTLSSRFLPVSRVHGDFTIDNILVDGSCVVGLDAWALYTNIIYHDIASFLNSLLLLRCTKLVSQTFLTTLRTAFLRGYFGGEPWDDLAISFLQRVGLPNVILEIRSRRASLVSRAVLTHVMVISMGALTKPGEVCA